MTPTVSAYAHLYGPHDFNKHPLAPIGCAVQMHEKPNQRKTWAPHAIDGWYVGTSFQHYRAYKIRAKSTKAERISDTVFIKHRYLTNPTVTPKDAVVKAAKDLTRALQGEIPQNDESMTALQQLEELFSKKAAEMSARDTEASPRVQTTPRVPAAPPRVETPSPRVQIVEAAQQEQQIVASAPQGLLVESPPADKANTPTPNYISQDEEEPPAYNTRGRRAAAARTLTQESILSAIDISSLQLNTAKLASRQFPRQVTCEMANAVVDAETGELMEYRHLMKNPKYREIWSKSYGDEIGRVFQGMPGRVDGTNTAFFVHKEAVPANRWKDVTYGRIVTSVRAGKAEPNRTRLTVGGDRINYPDDCGTPTANLLTVKLLINSIISTPGAKFMSVDIKDFYLNTPLTRYEYLRLKMKDLPEDVIEEYKLNDKATADGYVYCEIRRGMYGLPQAGILAQQLLEKRLKKHGYRQSKYTPGFWKHDKRPIQFTLVVDDFGVKYVGKEHADHLINALKEDYAITEDWDGAKFIGLDLHWDYKKQEVHLTMENYVAKALHRFQHETPKKKQNQPFPHVPIEYGAKTQFAAPADNSAPLNKADKKFIQEVTGVFLY